VARLTGDDIRIGIRFLAALPSFLRTPLSVQEARAIVRIRFLTRRDQLRARLRECWIPGHPYRRLFDHAGCTYEDIASLVARDGVEGALKVLFHSGVYLTVDEFKGRHPVTRGSLSFTVNPARLLNPRSLIHGLTQTSGSRGRATPVPIDLAFIRDHSVNTVLALDGYGGLDWDHAHYGGPGGTAVTNTLELAKAGRPPVKWFVPVALSAPGLSPRYRVGAAAMRAGGRIAGVPLPPPVVAPLNDPRPVARWIAASRARGHIPHVWGFASSAVLVCQAAADEGIDVSRARFTMGGEPTTAARRAVIEGAGALALPRMGATETDILAYACGRPSAPDDMHFFDDRHALIQPGRTGARASLPPEAMLLTTLLPSAPVTLVNVCLGDQAEMSRRDCGCGLERDGWRVHVSHVRSFEKLTIGGTNLLDTDLLRVLEEVLPARFGGRPTDYQLVEQLENERARPEALLLVSPSVGPVDPGAVIDVFLRAIWDGSGADRVLELQWRAASMIRVVREAPRRTASGKILHLHLDRTTV
jgi:hypothetical protein